MGKNAPKVNHDSDEVVCQFVDKYITGTLPNNTHRNKHDISLMQNLQKHAHSDYCHHNKSCCFGFPKPPSTETLISRPPTDDNKNEMISSAKNILHKVQDYISTIDTQDLSIDTVLKEVQIDLDEYICSLQISQ